MVLENKNKKKHFWLVILIVALIVFFVALCVLFKFLGVGNKELPEEVFNTDTVSQTDSETEYAENPVDFETLQNINSDIYAWISIPSCEIEYPIIQPTYEDDLYYLRRNIYRQYEYSGTIFTEKLNAKTFDDPNTVIYGHNMLNGTMFSNLLKFKDIEFFNENEYFYIYTPDTKYTYRIFSAYQYDDRHLLNSFNLSDSKVLSEYFEEASHPKSLIVNTREVELKNSDKIVTLSTCTGAKWEYRYLVQGVLISNEKTK